MKVTNPELQIAVLRTKIRMMDRDFALLKEYLLGFNTFSRDEKVVELIKRFEAIARS